jgi:hypothetical protein
MIKIKVKCEGKGTPTHYFITATCKINHYSCYNVEKCLFLFWVNRDDLTLHLNMKSHIIYPSNNLKSIFHKYYDSGEFEDNFYDINELKQMVDVIKSADDE